MDIAQWLEHLSDMQKVVGSNPTIHILSPYGVMVAQLPFME